MDLEAGNEYVENALSQYSWFGLHSVQDIQSLPINSDPTLADSDGDRYNDSIDKEKLRWCPYLNYNANNAIKYAEKWWDTEGMFYINGGVVSINPQNINNKYHYYAFGNCANYVSQCLCAGGFEMYGEGDKNGWHSYKVNGEEDISESWRLADKQYRYFKSSNYVSDKELILNSDNYENISTYI